mgnify:FL=1|tara:strand:- start:350 stop:670 length:321 start_codon:yes stop_codon:yes gene_type:complete
MKAIEKAKSHFDLQDIQSYYVEEWDLKIFWKPLTLGETAKLFKVSKEDSLTMMAMVLIYKALDEEGNKIFSIDDKPALLNNVDRNVLVKVAQLMTGEDTLEDTKKN